MLAALATVFFTVPPDHSGDVVEYTLQTVALGTHRTPDVRYSDLELGAVLAPDFAERYGKLRDAMRAGQANTYSTFAHGTDGKVYGVHFFTYAALAAVPFRLLWKAGMDPYKCFQAVNLASVFVLGLCLHRLLGSARKALFGVALFFACGGILYWNWSSPECFSAAALLSAMCLYTGGAPVRACLLAGLAAQQNPTILFFFACAPLLQWCAMAAAGDGPGGALRQLFGKRQLAGLALGAVLLAMPPLFNLARFGMPSIIAKHFSNPALIGAQRLHSFFLDLNQGLLVAIPALFGALLWWAVRDLAAQRAVHRPPLPAMTALCAALTLALAVPALAVTNWNSAAAGMMRYGFWAAMPLAFAVLWRLHAAPRWPLAGCALLLALQAGSMAHAMQYGYMEFSPLAQWVLRHAPQLYHPEPEIFIERLRHADGATDPAATFVYQRDGQPALTLYHRGQRGIEAALCGAGRELAPGNRITESINPWRYIDGPVRCRDENPDRLQLRVQQFQQLPEVLAAGWSRPEADGGEWDGVWSEGEVSQLRIQLPALQGKRWLAIHGRYLDGNRRTRVKLDGKDAGWVALDRFDTLELPEDKAPGTQLLVELVHEAPHQAAPQDTRKLAFFMQEVSVRQAQ